MRSGSAWRRPGGGAGAAARAEAPSRCSAALDRRPRLGRPRQRGIRRVRESLQRRVAHAKLDGLTPTLRWLHEHRPPPGPPVICHGDFHPRNLLVGRRAGDRRRSTGPTRSSPTREFDVAATLNILRFVPVDLAAPPTGAAGCSCGWPSADPGARAISRATGAAARSIRSGSPTTRSRAPCARWCRAARPGSGRAQALGALDVSSYAARAGGAGRAAHRGSPSRCPPCAPSRDKTLLMTWRIGVDIGGTFTDVVLADEAGGAHRGAQGPHHAARLRPRAWSPPCAAAMTAQAWRPPTSRWLAHATTVVTNALLRGQGRAHRADHHPGLRDVLELRRSARASLYDLFQDAPAVLVPRHLRLEVARARRRPGAGGRGRSHTEDVDRGGRRSSGATRSTPSRCACCTRFLNDTHERAIGERAPRGVARPAGLPVERGAAGDPRVRAHQHDRGVRLRRPDPGVAISARLEAAVTGMGLPAP